MDYLLKPISFERLLKSVNTYFDLYKNDENKAPKQSTLNDYLFVRADRKMVKVDFTDIIYIESLSDYIKIHNESNTIVTRENISEIDNILPNTEFIRIHRSYIISISKIESYTREFVSVGGNELSISRSYKKKVFAKLSGG